MRRIKLLQGFTLIEIMVVLVIISITVTFATITLLPWWQKRQITEFTQQVVSSMKYLQARAIISQSYFGMTLNETSLQFFQRKNNQWQTDPRLTQINWPNNSEIQLNVAGQTAGIEKKSDAPQIIFSPNGVITPFTLLVKTSRINYQITANLAGEITSGLITP